MVVSCTQPALYYTCTRAVLYLYTGCTVPIHGLYCTYTWAVLYLYIMLGSLLFQTTGRTNEMCIYNIYNEQNLFYMHSNVHMLLA